MPRYAIRQERALHTIYRDAPDWIEAVHQAREALVEHAKYGELEISVVPDNPDVYDQERDQQLEFAPEDDEAALMPLERAERPVETIEW